MMMQLTSNEISELRQRLGLSREAMATAVGCSIGAITAWEHGTRRPTALGYIHKLRMLARRADRYEASRTAAQAENALLQSTNEA